MVGQLITFPLRAGVFGARLLFRATEEVTERVTSGALSVVSVLTRDDSSARSTPATDATDREREPERDQREPTPTRDPRSQATGPVQPQPEARPPAAPIERPTAPPEPAPQPAHVSEEPELVREEAERGAEDGAGAAVTVLAPWDGYERMSAREVIARLATSNAAELAAVSLYESRNRSRQSVLDAVQRQLKTANGGDSSN